MTFRVSVALASALVLAATLAPLARAAGPTTLRFAFPSGTKSYVYAAVIKADAAIWRRLAHMPGQEVTTLSKAELARWKTAFQPIVDAWVKTTPDGARILAAFESEMAKARSHI